ncbi:MAG: hypothetical protein IJF21_07005 [Clostridia bacterium]|nr:hypothetical protein [Clostridia bacterium]
MKRIIALLLCLIMAVSAVACNSGNTPAETTKAPETQAPATDAPETQAPATDAPVETTEAPAETTMAPETTVAVETAPSYEFSSLSAAEQAALKAVMPVSLPDYSSYEIVTRAMSFDAGADEYVIGGNSKGSTKFVTEAEGAVFGQAVKLAAINDKGDNRTEIEVTPLADMDISTAKGIMFYVDFSNVLPHSDETKKMCTSVTINTNKYRAKGPNNGNGDGSAVGYYYMAGTWMQTSNINACRMEIPTNFAGWLYIPSTSFYGSDEGAGLGETFGDIFVMNMRCYTDGYTYSADNYIIFDEIVFVK